MLETDFDFTAESHKNFLEYVLGVFDKTLDNVICLIGDNCSTNKLCADLCSLPLVGCASHRFNLEVQAFLENFEAIILKALLFFLFFSIIINYLFLFTHMNRFMN